MGLRDFVDEPGTVLTVKSILEKATAEAKTRVRGPVKFALMAPDLDCEVEIDAGDQFHVTPQIKGAVKSLPGVITVEDA